MKRAAILFMVGALLSGCELLDNVRASLLNKTTETVERAGEQIEKTSSSVKKKIGEVKDAAQQVQEAADEVGEAVNAVKKLTGDDTSVALPAPVQAKKTPTLKDAKTIEE